MSLPAGVRIANPDRRIPYAIAMLIPLGTDRRLSRRPVVNPLLIAANVAITVWCYLAYGTDELGNLNTLPIVEYMLWPTDPRWYQFITYQFLHAGWLHLAGNMVFLFVFGSAIEDRFGRIGYTLFYLLGGVGAGVGTMVFGSGAPTLGASGSIAAVSGAFLALAPLSRVTMTWMFFHYFELPSIWLIGLYFAWDVFGQLSGGGGVAYMAHISGYVVGFGVGMALLRLRILKREMYDFLALIDRWNRRRQMRSVTRAGANPWRGGAVATRDARLSERDAALVAEREQIAAAMREQRFEEAIDLYEKLLEQRGDQVLPRDSQFDLANYAMRHQRHATAARAYELFIAAAAGDPRVVEARLLVGLICVRYLAEPARGRPHLEAVVGKVDGERKSLAEALLAESSA